MVMTTMAMMTMTMMMTIGADDDDEDDDDRRRFSSCHACDVATRGNTRTQARNHECMHELCVLSVNCLNDVFLTYLHKLN